MFKWYENSAVCYAYLSDVRENEAVSLDEKIPRFVIAYGSHEVGLCKSWYVIFETKSFIFSIFSYLWNYASVPCVSQLMESCHCSSTSNR
jgi:hypothetical protein